MSDGIDSTHVPGLGQPSTDLVQPLAEVGPYRVGALLGKGGMASVYLAQDALSGRTIALKLMHPQLLDDPSFVERFQNEARAVEGLVHPNVVELVGYGKAGAYHYIASEFVDGGTASHLIKATGGLPSEIAAELFTQLMAGMVAANERKIVHRDLKPDNLLLTQGGVLKIADFGIARTEDTTKLTQTGMLVGTARYMSPEQARGHKVDHRSDLFTCGIILFEMLTGRNPFEAESPSATLLKILKDDPPVLGAEAPYADPTLDLIVERLLRVSPQERFQTASEVLELLQPLVAKQRAERPTLVAECLKRPIEVKSKLDRARADRLLGEARTLSQSGPAEQSRAALRATVACLLVPNDSEAMKLAQTLSKRQTAMFAKATNPKIVELEASLEQAPNAPGVLQQLVQLHKLEGDYLSAVKYLRRYLRLKPNDSYAANQLFQITGDKTATLALGRETRELIQGIKTGGLKMTGTGTAPVTAVTEAFPARPSGPRPPRPAPAAPPPELDTGSDGPSLRALLPKLAVGAVILFVVVGVWRRVSRFVDDAIGAPRPTAPTAIERIERDAPPAANAPAGTTDPGAAAAAAPGTPPRTGELGAYQVPEVQDLNVPVERRVDTELEAQLAAAERLIGTDPEGALGLLDDVQQRSTTVTLKRRATFQRGKALIALKRANQAATVFTEFLLAGNADSLAAEALLRRGEAYVQNLSDAEGLADLDEFMNKYPVHALRGEAMLLRGELFARQGDLNRAAGALRAATGMLSPGPLRARAQAALDEVAKNLGP